MDNKNSSDTNNNEALRLANHNAASSHAPSSHPALSTVAPSTKHVQNNSVTRTERENGTDSSSTRGPVSPTSYHNPETRHEPQHTTEAIQNPQDLSSSATNCLDLCGHSPPGVTTEAVGSTASTTKPHVSESISRCNLCGKRCCKTSDLKRHLAYHLGKKPFKCQDCGKQFQVKSNMLLHQRAAHGDHYDHEFLECPSSVSTGSEMSVSAVDYKTTQSITFGSHSLTVPQCLTHDHEGEQLKRDAGTSDGSGKSDDSPGSSKGQAGSSISPNSNSGHSVGSHDREPMRGEEDDYSIDYPSSFPGLRHQLNVCNETVLVTRLDGVNKSTQEKLSLFKCHMCGKIFSFLSKLQCHLSMHFERTLNVFVCTYCDASFQFKTQLAQHLRRSHEVRINTSTDILDLSDVLPDDQESQTGPLSHEGQQTEPSSQASEDPVDAAERPSGYSTSTAMYRNSGSPDRGSTSGLGVYAYDGSSPPDDSRHYSVSARALYSRVNGLYMCQFCNKGFERLFSLSRHERVHTGFKPCYCKYCGRGFSEPRNLRHHIIRFHVGGGGLDASQKGELHGIRRLRKVLSLGRKSWRLNRRVSHSSQRLVYISPEVIAKSKKDRDKTVDASPPDRKTQLADGDARDAEREISTHHSPAQMSTSHHQHNTSSQGPPHYSQCPPIVIEPKADATSHKELANEIREKEKLDEDVTVVIPSEAPYGDKDRDQTTTPRSVCSESTNWSEAVPEAEPENYSVPNECIMSAPIRSLMGHQQYKSRRKMSFTATTPTPGSEDRVSSHCSPHDEPDIKPLIDLPLDLVTSSIPVHYSQDSSGLTAVSTALSLPFNPLSISTYMTPGLGGLLPSPLISPLNQAAFFAQQSLSSHPMVPNPLSFFNPICSVPSITSLIPTPSTATPPTTSHEAGLMDPPSGSGPGPTQGRKSHSPSVSESARGSLDDLQTWMSKSGGRGSALSRSHSSRLYVVRQPVKREEACKPIVLPDGRTVYRCTYCNKDFCTFSDVNRHMDFHEDIRPYKCKYCDYYARTNSQLKVHMMRHQGIREFHCKLCNYKGVTQSDLNRHMKSQIHMMKSQNECKNCGEGFVSPKNLERHYHEKHFSQYEKMASSRAAAAAAAAVAAQQHASKLGQGPGFQGNV